MQSSIIARRVAVGIAVGLTLGACGGSGKSHKAASTATTAPAVSSTSTTTAAPPAVVNTKTDPKLGTILADSQGMTLYTLTSNGKAVTCDATCASVWPPLELPPGVTTPSGGPGVTNLAAAAGPNGTMIVTFQGLPLYRFTKDKDSGDAYGEGLQSFGGTWHVVKTGKAAGTTPTSSSGSGY
jgi:predicted lipoprotein with Yx(FWY)xxD motif